MLHSNHLLKFLVTNKTHIYTLTLSFKSSSELHFTLEYFNKKEGLLLGATVNNETTIPLYLFSDMTEDIEIQTINRMGSYLIVCPGDEPCGGKYITPFTVKNKDAGPVNYTLAVSDDRLFAKNVTFFWRRYWYKDTGDLKERTVSVRNAKVILHLNHPNNNINHTNMLDDYNESTGLHCKELSPTLDLSVDNVYRYSNLQVLSSPQVTSSSCGACNYR